MVAITLVTTCAESFTRAAEPSAVASSHHADEVGGPAQGASVVGLREAEAMDPPPGVPSRPKRDDSPHPASEPSGSESSSSTPHHPTSQHHASRGSMLLKRRGTDGAAPPGAGPAGAVKNVHAALHVYEPPQSLPSQEEMRATFREQLKNQKQTTYSPADVDALDIKEVMKVISEHDVTFINTQTGSGKSTLVPKAIMEMDEDHRVVTTQPRRTATIRLAETVSGLCGESNVGEGQVGYWIRGDRRGGKHTRLWYMTSYTLLLHLLNNHMAPPFSHIIIDEFHERQPEIEVIVALLKLLLLKPRGKSNGFKLILMSATIEACEWEKYFEGLSWGLYTNDSQKYTVHEFHLEEASILTGAALRRPNTFSQTVVCHEMYDNSIYVAQLLIKLIIEESSLQHSILLFLPGRAAVSKLRRWVEAHLAHRLWPIPWHGSVELSWIKQQITTTIPGKQKIYLATDVAEVSITLPDAVFVIDTCLVKRPYIDRAEQSTVLYPQLVQQWCSKGSVMQRQGRVGRTQQGFYFSLLPAEYADSLEEYPSPPICNSRLDQLTLHLLHVCASPKALYTLCKRPPLDESVRVSLRALMELGAIIPTHLKEGHLTWSKDIIDAAVAANPQLGGDTQRYASSFLGIILQRLPVSVQPGTLIFYGLTLGLETLCIICAAIVQTAIPFVTVSAQGTDEMEGNDLISGQTYEATAQSKERTHRALEFFCRNAESDLIACIVVFLEWKRKVLAEEEVEQWSEEMCVSLERLVAIDELVVHLHNEMRSFFPCQSYVSDGSIVDAVSLQKQLKVHQPIMLWLICVTCAGNAVKVREVRNESRRQYRELGVPVFLKRSLTFPNPHFPSVVQPWRLGQIVVPVLISINEGRNSVAVLQTMAHSQFLLLLIMLFPVVRYGSGLLEDSQGTYRAFGVTINGITKKIRCPAAASALVIEFRQQFCDCVAALKYRRQCSKMDDVTFVNCLKDSMGGFSLLNARVDLMTQLWNGMKDPTAMPTEILMHVPLEEVSTFKPSVTFTQDGEQRVDPTEQREHTHADPNANPQFAYPDYMGDWCRAAAAAQAPQVAMTAAGYSGMPVQLAPGYLMPAMGPPHPANFMHNAASMYMQPRQPVDMMAAAAAAAAGIGAPLAPSREPVAAKEETREKQGVTDAYAALRKRGPLVEESSDEDDVPW